MSVYEFVDSQEPSPIIIYLHCNSGSRIEGYSYLEDIIDRGYAYCIFDFSGSGMSEGEYIS